MNLASAEDIIEASVDWEQVADTSPTGRLVVTLAEEIVRLKERVEKLEQHRTDAIRRGWPV